MIGGVLDQFSRLNDARLHPGCAAANFDALRERAGLDLPKAHRELLTASNGVEGFAGYVRIFGLGNPASVDAILWNAEDFWKFAWAGRCSKYWCFGETAWGDQYAYSTESLQNGVASPVYFLDCLSMTPEIIAPSFEEFFAGEFQRSAATPYDTMMLQAREKFGPLEINSHLVYTPSILLGGEEKIDNVTKMDARAAMICNGDIAVQLDAGPSNREVKSVRPYEDDLHRMRLELVWS